MLAFIRRSILLGIVTAVVLLVVFPELRTKMIQPQVSLTTVQTDQPSYPITLPSAVPLQPSSISITVATTPRTGSN